MPWRIWNEKRGSRGGHVFSFKYSRITRNGTAMFLSVEMRFSTLETAYASPLEDSVEGLG